MSTYAEQVWKMVSKGNGLLPIITNKVTLSLEGHLATISLPSVAKAKQFVRLMTEAKVTFIYPSA